MPWLAARFIAFQSKAHVEQNKEAAVWQPHLQQTRNG
jgi:hypothetical protein